MVNFNREFLTGLLVAGIFLMLYLGFGHYFRWPLSLMGGIRQRIFAYTYGVTGLILAMLISTMLSDRVYIHILELLILSGVGGLTVALCYWWDSRQVTNGHKRRQGLAAGGSDER